METTDQNSDELNRVGVAWTFYAWYSDFGFLIDVIFLIIKPKMREVR